MLKLKPTQLLKQHFAYSHHQFLSNSTSNYLNCHLDSFLSSNASSSSLRSLLQSHALIIATGNSNDNIFISSKLISLYAFFNKPRRSTRVFESIPISKKDVFLWNSVIKSHFSTGNYSESFGYYLKMRLSNTLPNDFTIPMVVSACAELRWDVCGRYVHGLVLKSGLFVVNSAVGSSFVFMYAKCSSAGDARLVFDEMIVKDVVTWTALVIGYVQNGESEKGLECLCDMHRVGEDGETRPNFRTLEGGLQACGNLCALDEGKCLHGFVVKTGLGFYPLVQSSIFSMYSRCGSVRDSSASFCEVVDKDIISWTSIISVKARFGFMKECLDMFWEMQVDRLRADGILISSIVSGFGNFMNVREGKAFHGLIIRRNLLLDKLVLNALLSMYCKFRLLSTAEKLFNIIGYNRKESWNIMVHGYCKTGQEAKAIELFKKMQQHGIEVDSNSLVSVIFSCSQLGAIRVGRSLHCQIVKSYMADNISVANSLIDMYGKSGNLTIARRIFNQTQRDVITWNTMMSAYSCSGHLSEVIALFDQMLLGNLAPNMATLLTVLSACSHLASWEKGERIHCYIKEGGYELCQSLATALIDMYAKCGQIEKSRELFISMKEKDVVSWNVMISGYAMHGDAKSALQIFQQMEESNAKPNDVTFLSLLNACSHAGLVKEGKFLFGRMEHYSIKPNLKHYACMTDLLGRSGNLQEAEALVMSMPISPDGGVWGALLSACVVHNENEMAIRIAKRVIDSDPENDGYYILISNVYTSMGWWEEAQRTREMMKERGVGKKTGWSAI
ncbi:Pentatricopeptide repeat-containing protein [Hibiscus syriacus]|uniref:Pentatricopeptide repeat-containing protein n=1 Tax=Hibiscus syriacus TaxID=106335 RepID=A0A6A2ZZD8_HIBSY|nr:pentatricopeptide repeat-containing protein At4g39952, mitochondrial [Hibiscus syriacus]KAE8697380.1 Pentatricopeptide repeat-containing protein [Hibiscus syriacus]